MSEVELDEEEVELALESLESAMTKAEIHLKYDDIRPSGHMMAMEIKDAYKYLVRSHPDYKLER